MNDKMTSAAVGVVAVVLAYALYSHFKGPASAAQKRVAAGSIAAIDPAGGVYNPAMPGQYVSTDNLIYGAATGQDWAALPTIDEMIYGVVSGDKPREFYGPSAPGRLW